MNSKLKQCRNNPPWNYEILENFSKIFWSVLKMLLFLFRTSNVRNDIGRRECFGKKIKCHEKTRLMFNANSLTNITLSQTCYWSSFGFDCYTSFSNLLNLNLEKQSIQKLILTQRLLYSSDMRRFSFLEVMHRQLLKRVLYYQ